MQFRIRQHLESPEEGLSELRRLYTDDDLSSGSLMSISVWSAYFGDLDFVMDVIEKVVRLNTAHSWFIWFTVMHEVRQLPRFKQLVKEIGLVDYWNKFGWPDIYHQLDNGDFECD